MTTIIGRASENECILWQIHSASNIYNGQSSQKAVLKCFFVYNSIIESFWEHLALETPKVIKQIERSIFSFESLKTTIVKVIIQPPLYTHKDKYRRSAGSSGVIFFIMDFFVSILLPAAYVIFRGLHGAYTSMHN